MRQRGAAIAATVSVVTLAVMVENMPWRQEARAVGSQCPDARARWIACGGIDGANAQVIGMAQLMQAISEGRLSTTRRF